MMDDEKITVDVKLKRSGTGEPIPGTLCLTFDGIAFVPQKSNKRATFLMTLGKIKNHKHSERGPLKFVLHDNEDLGPTFEFERLSLRDVTRNVFEIYKAFYQGVGDKFHPKKCMPDADEMDLRANALKADIHLKKLHDELVVAEVLTEFEFWDTIKTWLDLSSLKIPNGHTRSHTEGPVEFAGAHAGTTDAENGAIDKLADKTLEPEAPSSELEPSKETSGMESFVNKSPNGTSEVGSTQEIAEIESPDKKSEVKLSDADAGSQEKDTQTLAVKALLAFSTDEPSGDDDATDPQALHFRRLEAKLEAKIDKIEAKLEARIDKVEVKMGGVEAKLEARIDKVDEKLGGVEAKLEARIDKVDEKLDSIGKMLAAFIIKQGMAAAESGGILEARRCEVTQTVMPNQTKAVLDLYPEDHHQMILQSGLSSEVKEQLLYDNILANTLMVCFSTQKLHDGLFVFYKAGLLRNAMADVLEKLKSMNETPEMMPLVNPIKKRLGTAIGRFNDFVREEIRKTKNRVK